MALLLSLCLVATAPADRNRDATGLHGEWTLLETADARRVDPAPVGMRMTIVGDEITLKFAGMTMNRGKFAVGMSAGVHTIDMTFGNGQTLLGVFELRNNELIFCVDQTANGRPADLTPRGAQWQERWTRRQKIE